MYQDVLKFVITKIILLVMFFLFSTKWIQNFTKVIFNPRGPTINLLITFSISANESYPQGLQSIARSESYLSKITNRRSVRKREEEKKKRCSKSVPFEKSKFNRSNRLRLAIPSGRSLIYRGALLLSFEPELSLEIGSWIHFIKYFFTDYDLLLEICNRSTCNDRRMEKVSLCDSRFRQFDREIKLRWMQKKSRFSCEERKVQFFESLLEPRTWESTARTNWAMLRVTKRAENVTGFLLRPAR